jgi:L-fuculose-phosphate aldolase
MVPYFDQAREICETGRLLHERGFIAATEGNLSMRVGPDRVLCTPSMAEKGCLKPYDLCLVELQGRQIGGTRARTSELPMHLELYRRNPQTAAVVHCHPPYATAMAVSSIPLQSGLLAETEHFLQDIPVVPYAEPGSTALGELVGSHACRSRCAILRNHGALSWAENLTRARWWMEMLEAYCRTLILARALGPYSTLSSTEVAAARAAGRRQAGPP